MSFKRGDSAVYPGCGVGVVREIERIDLGEGTTEMYVIQFPADGTKVWVPTIAAQEQGMRKVMNAKKAEETYSAIRRQALPERLVPREPSALEQHADDIGALLPPQNGGRTATLKLQVAAIFGDVL